MIYALLTLTLMANTIGVPGEANIYQVTAPVNEVYDNFIVMQIGNEEWQIARDLETQGGYDLTAGDTVTVQFSMHAKSIVKESANNRRR